MVNTITPEVVRLYNLLKDYSFDVDAQVTEAVVEQWLQEFDLVWISHAVTEALYQGRYKLVSIEQILRLWQRRGHPIRHFNREFETLILGQTLLCCPEAPDPEVSKTLLPRTAFGDQATDTELLPDSLQQEQLSVEGLPLGWAHNASVATHTPSLFPIDGHLQPQGQRSQVENATAWFQSATPRPEFRPVKGDASVELYHPEPIRPFVPRQEVSTLHQRLKAVVQAGAQQ